MDKLLTDRRSDIKHQSTYLDYLPAIFQDDEFAGRFLLIFESILKPIERSVDNLALYLDPLITPEPILPWLASWMDLVLESSWPESRRRELVKSASWLYRWRGTKRGLSEYLRIYTGTMPQISDHVPGFRLDRESRLGVNTQLGSSGAGYHFTVTLELDVSSEIADHMIRKIIDSQKPAHTVYTLQITRSKREGEDTHGA